MRCRHERSWLIAGAEYEWCWLCGALKRLAPVEGSTNAVKSASGWARPTGDRNAPNPYGKWKKTFK